MKQLCQRNDCTTYATYNFPGMSKRRFCGRHALTGMVNVKQKPKPNLGPRQSQSSLENACIYGTCQDTAVYGWRDNPTKVFCIAHTLPGMVVDAEPLDPGQDCLYDGCSNTASCSYKGPKSSLRPRFCDMHKRPGMSLTKTHFDQPMTKQETSCIYGECHELAAFNFRTLPARFCGLHISDGMVGATDSSADTTTHEQDKMAPDKVQQPKLGAETQKPDSASENSKPQIQEKTSPTPTVSTGLAEKSRPTASSQSTHIFCVREGCDLTASYGTSGEAKPQFCSLHSRPGMRLLTASALAPTTGASGIVKKWGAAVPSLTKNRCEKAGCLRWATCGLAGTDVARFCPDHKQLHMVAVVGAQPGRKRCRVKGCVGLAEWGEPRTNNALVCQVHKNDGMVMINTRWFCRAKGCTKYASYNVPGKRRAFCLEHRSEDMVDVRKLPLCHQSPCPRFATCNFSGAAKVRFCAQHSQEGMVDIQLERELKSGQCAAAECVGWGSYGDAALAGARVGVKRLQAAKKFCSLHKIPGMVLLPSPAKAARPTCLMPGCNRHPHYNWPGERRKIACGAHLQKGMVAVAKPAGACQAPSCAERAYYNWQVEDISERGGKVKRAWCGAHKQPGMVNLAKPKPGRICEFLGCAVRGSYNFQGEKRRRFCASHKLVGMVYLGKQVSTSVSEGGGATGSDQEEEEASTSVSDGGISGADLLTPKLEETASADDVLTPKIDGTDVFLV